MRLVKRFSKRSPFVGMFTLDQIIYKIANVVFYYYLLEFVLKRIIITLLDRLMVQSFSSLVANLQQETNKSQLEYQYL